MPPGGFARSISIVVVAVLVAAAASSAFAEPAPPADGARATTASSVASGTAGGSAAIPGVASPSLAARPPAPTPPAPTPTGPPGTVALTPPGSATAAADGPENRNGIFVSGTLTAGLIAMAELRAGWVIESRVSLFATAAKAVVVGDDGGPMTILGGGVRLWVNRMFVEARAIGIKSDSSCELDEPCEHRREFLGELGFGAELLYTRHAGFEVRIDTITNGRDRAFLGTFGLSIYL